MDCSSCKHSRRIKTKLQAPCLQLSSDDPKPSSPSLPDRRLRCSAMESSFLDAIPEETLWNVICNLSERPRDCNWRCYLSARQVEHLLKASDAAATLFQKKLDNVHFSTDPNPVPVHFRALDGAVEISEFLDCAARERLQTLRLQLKSVSMDTGSLARLQYKFLPCSA